MPISSVGPIRAGTPIAALDRAVGLVVERSVEDQGEGSDGCDGPEVGGEGRLCLGDERLGLVTVLAALDRHQPTGGDLSCFDLKHEICLLAQD